MGHGSDVQNLMTTAVYDPLSETFTLNSNGLESMKWWPGDLVIFTINLIKSQKY